MHSVSDLQKISTRVSFKLVIPDMEAFFVLSALVFSSALAILSVIGILYLVKKLKQSRSKAEEDRRNFTHLFIPVLLFSAFALWLLFFRNPFKRGSVKNTAKFAQSMLSTGSSSSLELGPTSSGVSSGLLGAVAESLGFSSVGLGKKFLLGFLCGLSSIVAFRNGYTTNNFIKAVVLQ